MRIEPRRSGTLALALALVIGYGMTLTDAQTPPSPPPVLAPAAAPGAALAGTVGETQTGLAAYYSRRLHAGRTASGERFNSGALTTAHQTLPFGTKVRVTNLKNNRSVVLRVNDRGPTQPNRVVDVSRAAAERLGFVRAGLTEVKVEVIEAPKPRASGKKK
jgi:rare lipoprotein A